MRRHYNLFNVTRPNSSSITGGNSQKCIGKGAKIYLRKSRKIVLFFHYFSMKIPKKEFFFKIKEGRKEYLVG